MCRVKVVKYEAKQLSRRVMSRYPIECVGKSTEAECGSILVVTDEWGVTLPTQQRNGSLQLLCWDDTTNFLF